MDSDPRDPHGFPQRLKEWLKGTREGRGARFQGIANSLRRRLPKRYERVEFDLKKLDLKRITERSGWISWGLLVLALFLLADVVARMAGLFVPSVYTPMPRKGPSGSRAGQMGGADYDAILRRNMFNVEGKIPDPFDQGLLDCLSQAKPTTQRLQLMGTLVTNDDRFSVALVQEEGNPIRFAVKKDEFFSDGKFQAMKVERKKLCFQVRSTQELEFIEIPEEGLGLTSPQLSSSDGILPVNDREFRIRPDFLQSKLQNLSEILQTAKAVPYTDPTSGKFMGFLIQSVDPNSPFAQLGIRQGDVLTQVNDIVLDNAGKGLEAFQRLRNSQSVTLGVVRGGEKTSLTYEVK
jgi:general secretion pathway protein C